MSGGMRVAILGTGAIAEAHADAVSQLDDVVLIAVADRDLERAAAFAARWDVPAVYGTLEEMLLAETGLDAVHICTPQGLHHAQALQVLNAGVHAIVEKPPALTLSEFDDMTDAAVANDRALVVVFQQRAGSAAGHVKRLIDSGALGRARVATCETLWFRDDAYFDVPGRATWASDGGGVTISLAIHQIDLLGWLLGEWSTVQGQWWRLGRQIEAEDVSMAAVRFESGAVASIVSSVLSPRQTSSIRIDTELATITLDHLYGHGHENWVITPAPDIPPEVVESWRLPPEEERSGHRAFLREVFEAIREGVPLPDVAASPRRSLEIVSGIYASASGQHPISRLNGA